MGMGYSSSDSLDHHPMQARNYYDSGGLTSTPKLSSISGAKTETSSMDASIRSSSSRDADRSGELSISNASDLETEWVEQDEPGVYITIRALPGGKRELRRVRFRWASAANFMIISEEAYHVKVLWLGNCRKTGLMAWFVLLGCHKFSDSIVVKQCFLVHVVKLWSLLQMFAPCDKEMLPEEHSQHRLTAVLFSFDLWKPF